MDARATTKNHYLRAAVVFGACLLVVFLLPFIGFFLNSNLLFFAPQWLFPYDGFVVREPNLSRAVFGHHVALVLTFVQWGLASIGFAWFARRISFGYTILAAVVAIAVIGIATNVAFGLFGVTVELDGP
jgi:hypothetical protein